MKIVCFCNYIYKPLVLVSKVFYFANRSLYLVVKSVYLVDKSVFLATTSPFFLSNAWIWDWIRSGSFSKIPFLAIVFTKKSNKRKQATIILSARGLRRQNSRTRLTPPKKKMKTFGHFYFFTQKKYCFVTNLEKFKHLYI